MIDKPEPLTWKRLRRFARRKVSLLREMEHEVFERIVLEGRSIDIGGGAKATYLGSITNRGVLDSINIDPEIEPTLVADLNMPLPLEDEIYDNAISFNTFEHVENDTLALSEMMRVLKPGGHFHFVVPFIYQVHGAPSDFHRHTHHEWNRRLLALGLDPAEYSIRPLVWDPISTACSTLEGAVPRLRWMLKPVSLVPGLIYYSLKRPEHGWNALAIGYYVHGCKRSRAAS